MLRKYDLMLLSVIILSCNEVTTLRDEIGLDDSTESDVDTPTPPTTNAKESVQVFEPTEKEKDQFYEEFSQGNAVLCASREQFKNGIVTMGNCLQSDILTQDLFNQLIANSTTLFAGKKIDRSSGNPFKPNDNTISTYNCGVLVLGRHGFGGSDCDLEYERTLTN